MDLAIAHRLPNLPRAREGDAGWKQGSLISLSEREQITRVNVVGCRVPFWERWKLHGVVTWQLTVWTSDPAPKAHSILTNAIAGFAAARWLDEAIP